MKRILMILWFMFVGALASYGTLKFFEPAIHETDVFESVTMKKTNRKPFDKERFNGYK